MYSWNPTRIIQYHQNLFKHNLIANRDEMEPITANNLENHVY
jgi:hypothetical protein